MSGQETRNKLTDYWKGAGVKERQEFAELSTRQIAETQQAKGFRQNAVAGKRGGTIARDARKELEAQTGRSVITGENFLSDKK